MSWTNVKLIFCRELRDQMRDRRTLFTIVVLPLLLYPILAMLAFQVQQFRKEYPSKILVVGAEGLPAEPPLFEERHFAASVCPDREAKLIELQISETKAAGQTNLEVSEAATADLRAGKWDAVVYFPPEFSRRLAAAQEANSSTPETNLPQPEIFLSTASDKSQVAHNRVATVLGRWRDAMIAGNLRQNNLPITAVAPFDLENTDVAEPVQARAAVWSKLLPFVLLIWALTGAFYPAIDLCAGEKERGTLETLLSSPAKRSEIVWGKLLTVMTFSMATSLLNLASMGVTGTFIAAQLEKMATSPLPMHIGPPPLAAIFWLVLALVPISAMFSALSLAVAAFARSSKEGQYYLLPLLMISLPLMMLSLLPNSQLEVGTAMIPLTGMMLLVIPIVIGPITLLGRRLRKLSVLNQDRIAEIGTTASETLAAMKIVQAFTQEVRETARFATTVENNFAVAKRRIRLRATLTAIVIFLVAGSITLVLWQGAADVAKGHLSGGAIASFVVTAMIVAG
ncbi:MAG: ABC transporter permease subunit, partial [Planctomycetales bacterium]|nr:ABC transporter permease subunit [Planctomycetales bacterium]